MKPKLIKDLGMLPVGTQGKRCRKGIYECPKCEKHWVVATTCIKNNVIKMCRSCGNTTHGFHGTRLYKVWEDMLARCRNKNIKAYVNYGGRGISVYKHWCKFEYFKKWALKNGYSDDLFIERKNNDGNYTPYNCKFATRSEQNSNRRPYKHTHRNGIKL